MNSLLLKSGTLRVSPSLLALNEWHEKEKQSLHCAVDEEGCLLDNLTLELRVHPPEVHIDNAGDSNYTHVTIDSANRPGSLIYVVQHFTELGLRINNARISSDGGWFHDSFIISEAHGGKVRNSKKLSSIKQMLNVYMQDEEIVQNGDDTDDSHRIETTIFEASGLDRTGLVADVMQLLTRHDCDVRSAAVWTYKGRVAFVLSVTEKGRPIIESIKLDNLNQLIYRIMESPGSTTIVRAQKVRGEVHHDRRLHQLMLQDEMRGWMDSNNSKQILSSESEALQNGPDVKTTASSNLKVNDSAAELDHLLDYRSPKFDQPIIDISHCSYPNYWTINIKCKDRTKLLFDTVCTLADMEYDIYHATIDASSEGVASQEYFVRPRLGDADFNGNDAELLKAMLDSSIQRRFPKGLKVHVRSSDRFGCLASLARQLQVAGLSISRAKVRTFATSNSCGHTLYVMNSDGAMPDKRRVEQVLIDSGGRMADLNSFATSSATCDGARFDFTFLERQQGQGGSPPNSYAGSF